QTATWIAILSFPVFALCVAFAEPVVVLLFGEPYRSAGTVLSILCIGYYINGSIGFNSLLLRVFGRVRYMVTTDLTTAAISIVATVFLIRAFGAVGAAMGTTATLLVQNGLYQWGLRTRTTVEAVDARFIRPYASIFVGAVLAVLISRLIDPPLVVGVIVVGLISLAVLGLNRHALRVLETYPELGRFPLVRRIFGDPSPT
ncbi:MAG TPA: polysaccharide biosynthesis C-terminal domain-containing protein, partial [Actinomycetes bacterium]|nr:polysaccharide biosynthesis C-terminal domain-containing protein [Actinomycetes bacterium]